MFSSQFPEGLRVFVFDEDPEYLLILDTYFQKFQYQVTTCNEEARAMDLLRKDSFNIAIIDAQKSHDDRFRLFSQIRSEMNIPIIIMSKDYSVESVINWMKKGACDYLLKPISPEDLRLIFKHLVKKIQIGSSIVAAAGEAENSSFVGDTTLGNTNNKRKRSLSEDQDDHDHPSTSKERRVVWDEMLHKKFIEAVEYLGNDKAVPKKILEYMNVEGITRENVASHLQKFRMNIKKRNEQNEGSKQDSRIYGGQEATNFYRDTNVQFSTPHTSSLQPCMSQHEDIQPNLTTQLLSRLGHHHHLVDGVSVAVSNGNLMMSHHYQTSELAYIENAEENLGYNTFETHNEDAIVVKNLTSLSMQNQQEVGLYHFEEPSTISHHLSTFLEINPQQMMNAHESQPSMLHFPSYAHSSFPEEPQILNMADESGRFNYNRDSSVNINKLT